MDELENDFEECNLFSVLDRLMHDEPMKWQSYMCDRDVNEMSLKMMNEWIGMEWFEKELARDDYPELAFLSDEGDDSLVVEMRDELLASMN